MEKKMYVCEACRHETDKPLVHLIPKAPGQVDSAGYYCTRCLQDWIWRNIPKMKEK